MPGDLVILEAGDVVPADLRLLETTDVQIDESALTGESLSVSKSIEMLHDEDLVVGDRLNMAYKSTSMSRGRAKGIVVATGLDTEIGKIAALLNAEEGVLEPIGNDREQWRFSAASLQRAHVTLRLLRNLGINLAGIALALELLDKIETLRTHLSRLDVLNET